MGWRRIAAGLLDMALLFLPGAVLYSLSAMASFLYMELIFATATLYFAGFHLRLARTPGKMLMGLRVTGQGCILCREIRKCAVLILPSIVGILGVWWTQPPITSTNLFWIETLVPVSLLLVAFLGLITLAFNKSPHWDRATGFDVKQL